MSLGVATTSCAELSGRTVRLRPSLRGSCPHLDDPHRNKFRMRSTRLARGQAGLDLGGHQTRNNSSPPRDFFPHSSISYMLVLGRDPRQPLDCGKNAGPSRERAGSCSRSKGGRLGRLRYTTESIQSAYLSSWLEHYGQPPRCRGRSAGSVVKGLYGLSGLPGELAFLHLAGTHRGECRPGKAQEARFVERVLAG